jgi:hypothetical protein
LNSQSGTRPFGNALLRYLQSSEYVKDATSEREMNKATSTASDPRLMIA